MNPPSFLSPALRLRSLRASAAADAPRLAFAWERDEGCAARFELPLPRGAEKDPDVLRLAERCVKAVLWSAGGWRLWLAGPDAVCRAIESAYAPGGARQFDRDLMERVYQRPVAVVRCAAEALPALRDATRSTGVSWRGCRLGFDLGASDFKLAAVEDGTVRFSAEFPWNPRNAADPAYHYGKLNEGLRQAAEHLPRVDAIGGSTAGIVVGNCLRSASLFRAVPSERYAEAREMFLKLERAWGVPVEVANDGDVTALAAYLADGSTGVLGVAMGSSEAAGYINRAGQLTGRISELAFAPVDLAPDAPADEWSGDAGVGAMYFSQQAVNRLARHYGVVFPAEVPLPERLVEVQRRMAAGDPAARRIYETIGEHLGHTVAWYREFYDYEHLLVLGRVTTGAGGGVLLDRARAALSAHYPDLADAIHLRMPDEKSKRLGQAVAAAALARSASTAP